MMFAAAQSNPIKMAPAPICRPLRAPMLHADDRERLEYLHARLLESGSGAESADEILALMVRCMAARGDEWALRVTRCWMQSHASPLAGRL